MSDIDDTPEEPSPELVEAMAKQLFRAENPPSLLWDTKLFEASGRSTEGFQVAADEARDAYRKRAHEMLLEAPQ